MTGSKEVRINDGVSRIGVVCGHDDDEDPSPVNIPGGFDCK